MSFLDQLSAKVNQGFNQVTSQTKDFTEQVKIENEIKNLEKAAQANYEELGRAMYNASRHPSGEAASVGGAISGEGAAGAASSGTAFSGEDVSAGAVSSGAAADYEVIMRQIDGILQQIQEKKAAKQEIMNRVTCPSCGKSVPAGTKFCSYCGAPMEQTPVAAAVLAEPQMCGGERQMGDDKPQMGGGERQMGGERHCPNCGEVIEPGAKFCVKCGTRIDAGEQKPAETGDSGSSEIGDSCSAGAGDFAEKEEEISTD